MVEEKLVKGAVLNGYAKFIFKTWGKVGLEECERDLDIDFSKYRDGHWYDDRYSTMVIDWIAEKKGQDYLVRCGKFTIHNMGLLSYIVRFVDMKTMLKNTPKSYAESFNFGNVELDVQDKKAVMKIYGNVSQHKNDCHVWTGIFEGMLEITKSKGTVAETKCECEGADHCEFLVTWE